MKKKRNIIGACLVAALMLALTVIGYAAGDGEAAPAYGAWCLVPPLVTIVLAFVTKQTIISMFIGIWVGATIIHHFNPIDGLIGSFTGYLVPSVADSWNAGMLIIMALIGGFMYMRSACGGAEAFGRWAEKLANNRKKSPAGLDRPLRVHLQPGLSAGGCHHASCYRQDPHLPRKAGLYHRRHGRTAGLHVPHQR